MKKIFCIFLCIIISLSLSGCYAEDLYKKAKESFNSISVEENTVNIEYSIVETIGETEVEYHSTELFYNELNSVQQQIYRVLLSCSEQMPEGFVKIGEYNNNIEKNICIAYSALLYDMPQIFWMPNTYIIGNAVSKDKRYVTIAFSYNKNKNLKTSYSVTKSEREEMRIKLNKKIDSIVSDCYKYNDDYNREKFFNDYICKNSRYNLEANLNDTSYGCLINNNAICEGYSKAFKILCNKVGMDCMVITGECEGQGHMWNCTKIDDRWSYTDVTWNDRSEDESHLYFNISEQQLLFDHSIYNLVSSFKNYDEIKGNSFNFKIYNCNSIKDTAYYKEELIASDNYKDLALKIYKCSFNNKKYIEFLFIDKDSLDLFKKDNNQYIKNIQNYLFLHSITKYALERDVLILYWK